MSSFAESFQGSMGAILAGLSIAAGGLLSQVPVIGEAFAGLRAIVDAVALRLDSVLRPVFGPITDKLFQLANAIIQADGKMGLFVDTILVIITALGTIAGIIATVSAVATVLAGTFATIVSVGGTIVTILGSVGAAILSLPVVLAAAIAALAGFVLAYITNWKGTRDKTNEIINRIIYLVRNGFRVMLGKARKLLKKFVKKAKKKFNKVKTNTVNTFNDLIDSALQFGKDLVSEFADGIRDKIGDAIAAASELASEVRDRLPGSPAAMGPLSDLDETGPGLVDTFIGGIDSGQLRVGLNADGDETNAGTALARQEGRTIIEIEGRQVERATRDFRSDGTDLRGRYG